MFFAERPSVVQDNKLRPRIIEISNNADVPRGSTVEMSCVIINSNHLNVRYHVLFYER